MIVLAVDSTPGPAMNRSYLSVGLASMLWLLSAAATPDLASASVLEKLFAPKARLWSVWETNQPASTQAIDHQVWDNFLGEYVEQGADGINRIAYDKVPPADRASLSAYIEHLETIPISTYSRDEQLAYWINLYNALALEVVLRHYPVESIRDINITKRLFAKGPWGKKLLTIEGLQVSLNDIEHRILRPIWQDPRIHYAVNCASIGCPNLMPAAFTVENTETLLQQGARSYEQIAYDCAMSQTEFAGDSTCRFFDRQARQERYHAQVFKRVVRCVTPFATAPIPPGLNRYRANLEAACRRRDLVESLLGQQVVLEGFGELVLYRMDRKFDERGIGFKRVRKILLHQEQGHLAFGERLLRGILESGTVRVGRIQEIASSYLHQVDRILDDLQPTFEVVGADCHAYKPELRQRLPRWILPR